MGLFKRKRDPIGERARALNDQIAELEAQIQRLAAEQTLPQAPTPAVPQNQPPSARRPDPAPRPQPRLRSTTLPHGPTIKAPPGPALAEPIFEDIDQDRIQSPPQPATADPPNELGVRKNDLAALWVRLKSNFRGPATSNPKLVNYLAAGSIQGLRPLRYEKRVARNRFFVLVIILAAVLWGIIFVFVIRK